MLFDFLFKRNETEDIDVLPFQIIDLKQGTKKWRNWRHGGIGASDASIIMLENRFKSPEELRFLKKNKIDEKPNFKMQQGTMLEPEAREQYQKATGIIVKPICLQSKMYPWLIASLDGISDDFKKLVEIKCGESAYKKATNHTIPDYYYGQLQHQLMITGLNKMDYWACWPGKKGVRIKVKRDKSYISKLFKEELIFFNTLWAEKV